MKKLFIIFIGVLAAILALTAFVVSILSRDIPPPDTKDLAPRQVIIPREENAFYDLERLGNSADGTLIVREPASILDYLVGKEWNATVIAKALEENKQALSFFDAAVQKSKFQDPAFAEPTTISLEARPAVIGSLQKIARVSALKALYLMKQGREKEAIEEAMKSIELGGKVQGSQGTMIHYLTGMAMKQVGLEVMQRIVREAKTLSPDVLRSYIPRLVKFTQNEDALRQAFKMEYYLNAQSIDMMASGKLWFGTDLGILPAPGVDSPYVEKLLKNRFYFKPNKTKLLFVQFYRDHIAAVEKPCAQIEIKEPERKIPNPSSVKLLVTENAVGELMYDASVGGLKNVIISKCEEDFLVAATQLIFALRAYKLERNNLPVSLQDLVPQYISQIPQDPFDGKPIRYSATKKILYSVGQDGIDSGGSGGERWQEMPDPTFKLNF
jgi:hypothetical protein